MPILAIIIPAVAQRGFFFDLSPKIPKITAETPNTKPANGTKETITETIPAANEATDAPRGLLRVVGVGVFVGIITPLRLCT